MQFDINTEIQKNKSSCQIGEAASWDIHEFYDALMNDSILGITVVDTNYKIVLTNSMFCKLFKKSKDEFVGKYCFKEYEKRDEVCPHCPGRQAMATGSPSEVETQAVLDDGTRVHVRNRAIPIFSNDGQVKGFIEMVEDIDKRKKAELELKRTLSLYTATLESTADGILVVDINGKIQSCNKKFLQLWNLPEKIIEDKDDEKLLNFVLNQLSDPEGFIKKVHRYYSHPEETSCDILEFKDGRIFERYSQSQKIDGEIVGRVWSFRDITEQKKTEEKLRNNEEHLSIILNSILAGVVMLDAETHQIVNCNLQFQKMVGLPKEEIVGKVCHKFICPAEQGKCPISDLCQTVDMSERVLLRTGKEKIPILKTVTPINWQNHSYLIESFIDITQLKDAEKALWTSEERFRIAAKLASDLIWELDVKTGLMEWFGDIDGKLGYEKGEFPRTLQAWESIIHPDDYRGVINRKEGHIKGIKPFDTEYRVKRKDGKFLYWTDCGTIISDKAGKSERMIGVCSDITNRRESEHKQTKLLEQLEKVNDELKSFAYIVSHDLKAPLRGVKVLADWLCADYADKLGQEGKEQFELLVSRVDRMQNLINGILQYSRIGRVEEYISEIDTREIIADVIDAISPPENIKIIINEQMPVVMYERTRIFQVFQNLISNAVKYMDKEEGIIKIDFTEDEDFWKFSINDNGPGIKENYFEKIFQMFQTLSPRDQFESTGVGLTVVKKIIELYGGRIWVESQVKNGSTFLFTIPKHKLEDERISNEELHTNSVS
ncbi:MAG: PAS domain S-box protein [Sedimentisphaerales bacterium]|nr:PAS domain S-box protein [Sedimentisphaerales bacterium]